MTAREQMLFIASRFHMDKALRHQTGNIEVENTFRDLLNELYGWQLVNTNFGSASADTLDLHDLQKRIAIQVTTTQSPAKIRKTLKGFQKHRSKYDKLLFLYPCTDKKTTTADFTAAAAGFAFDPKSDRMDFSDLLVRMQQLSREQQKRFLDLLIREAAPYAPPGLQFPMEMNTAAIVTIIQHISEMPADTLASDELKPDAERKLERFQPWREYLQQQFTLNRPAYLAVEAARVAVGYDSARATRCAIWLKLRSLRLLDENGQNARAAFDALVDYFDGVIKQQRTNNLDQNAICYYLADEMLRCNVFPNPDDVNV